MRYRREISNSCASCGVAFAMGPLFRDYISRLRERGLRRTLNFDYRFYERLCGHEPSPEWPSQVSAADCDSIFLGDVIDPEMRCPKCGGYAFPTDGA
jgi:hypothetical protein